MADEQTQTQQDSTNSETTKANDAAATTTENTEQQTTADTAADDKVAAVETKDTSVLGGEVEDKAKEGDDTPAGPPEKYELALEGVTLDPEALAAADPVFRELNLTNDQANKLMPVAQDFAKRTSEATVQQLIEAGAQQKKAWLDEFTADPEIGGAKREETEHLAAKALDAMGYTATGFGDDKKQPHPFRKALTESGFGNHPDMIRMARKLGEMVGEDGFVTPNGASTQKLDLADRMYGKN